MIRNTKLDELVKPERTRAIRRRTNYVKAKRFKKSMKETYNDTWIDNYSLGYFIKNSHRNFNKLDAGWYKTKNKGPNHNSTYAPTHNYKHSDAKKLLRMSSSYHDYLINVA